MFKQKYCYLYKHIFVLYVNAQKADKTLIIFISVIRVTALDNFIVDVISNVILNSLKALNNYFY